MGKRRYIKLLLKFRYAFRGISFVWKTQKSFRIQCIIGIIANLILWHPSVIIVTIFILSLEIINTVIERICNFINPKYNKAIEIIKDISAGSVFLACFGAIIYGLILLYEKFIPLINVF